MKRTFFLLILAVFPIGSAFAQLWQQTNGPSGSDMRVVGVNSKGHIFVVSNSLFRSTNGGQSWKKLIPPALGTTISFSPTDDLFLYIPNNGLWLSVDNGESWKKISSLPLAGILPDGKLYLSDTSGNGYLVSSDNGTTWTKQFTYGIEAPESIWKTRNGKYFLLSQLQLYRSDDSARTWSKVFIDVSAPVREFCEAPDGQLFVNVMGGYKKHVLYVSSNSGNTWKYDSINALGGYRLDDIYDLVISPQGTVAFRDDYAVYFSVDTGKNWDYISAYDVTSIMADNFGKFWIVIPGEQAYSTTLQKPLTKTYLSIPNSSVLSVYRYSSGDITSVTSYGQLTIGNWISTDEGDSWGGVNNKSNFHPMLESYNAVAVDNQQTVIALSGNELFKSLDSGRTWLSVSTIPNECTGIVIHPSGDYFITSATDGVFLSIDSGLTWKLVNFGIPSPHLYSIVLNKTGDLYVGGDSIIYMSSDLGYSWTPLPMNFPSSFGPITGIVINARGEIVASLKKNGVFLSADNGLTWEMRDPSQLLHPPINALLNTPSGIIFTATNDGVFYLDTASSATWRPMNDGFTTRIVTSLCIDKDGRLFAGTDGAGVFKSTQTFNVAHQVSVRNTETTADHYLSSVFPNPVLNGSTIGFALTKVEFVHLDVVDLLGRVVATLADQVFDAGAHVANFNTNGLSAGTYYVRLRIGNSISIKTLVKTTGQ